MTEPTIITTAEKEVEFYNPVNQEWEVVTLPTKETIVSENTYQWRDTRGTIEWLQTNGFQMLNAQFGDAKKTAYYQLDNSIFDEFQFDDPIEWDNVYHQSRGTKPEVGQLKIVAEAIVSAKPNFQNQVNLGIHRYWCSNGATSAVFSRKIDIPEMSIGYFQEALDAIPSINYLEQELLSDVVITSRTADKIQNFRNDVLHRLIIPKRGESAEGLSSVRLENHFKSLSNAPQWMLKEIDSQFEMIQDSGIQTVTAFDIDNVITNVVNHGHSNEDKRNSNFYLMRNAAKMSNVISTALALS